MPEELNKLSDNSETIEKTKLEEKIEEVKKVWIEEIINKKNETFWDKVTSWFNKIEFLELEKEEKTEVAIKVKNNANPDRLYWIEIFLSSIIASFWLLQNSVAVIIGAMLIAPFLRPINGIAFGIARWEKKFFINSVKVLFISSLVSVIMWFIVINLTWLYKETPEMLARTSPNIIDLFIAIFSAMVALLSLRYKRLWESVAWVAMAAALMPPLWVIWMELALWNYNLAWWAGMLFLINIVAIILVWVWAFWVYWFTPTDWTKQKKAFIRMFLVLFLIWIISIPLFQNLLFLRDKGFVEEKIDKNLEIIINNKLEKFKISEINIRELTKNKVKIDLIIKIEQWVKFYDNFKNYIEDSLREKIWRDTEINIEIIVVAKILSEKEEEAEKIKDKKLHEKIKSKNIEEQKTLINNIKKEFNEEINTKLKKEIEKKLKKEIEEKLKKEIEEKLQREFNLLLEKKLLEINSEDTWSWVLSWTWKTKK